jgi:hypothetical protein
MGVCAVRKKSLASIVSVVIAVGGFLPFTPAAGAASSAPQVVVSGLNNPGQLVLVSGSRGQELLVAEGGSGGKTRIDGIDFSWNVGFTGSVSSVYSPATATNTMPERVVTHLFSSALIGGFGGNAIGNGNLSVAARFSGGKIYSLVRAPADVQRAVSGQSPHLLFSQHNGPAFPLQKVSTDATAVLARRDDILVADRASNSILRYANQGYGPASVFAVLPQDPACVGPLPDNCRSGPSSLAQDTAGNVYVAVYGGGVEPGPGRVVKLDPAGRVVKTWFGLREPVGVAVGADGSLYVSEFFADSTSGILGAVTQISPDGTRTSIEVPNPSGVAVDASNNVYAVAFTGSLSGQVWRLRF